MVADVPLTLQLLPALDHIELTFRKDWENGDKEAALVFTGERVKNKFFRCVSSSGGATRDY